MLENGISAPKDPFKMFLQVTGGHFLRGTDAMLSLAFSAANSAPYRSLDDWGSNGMPSLMVVIGNEPLFVRSCAIIEICQCGVAAANYSLIPPLVARYRFVCSEGRELSVHIQFRCRFCTRASCRLRK